MKRLFLAAAFMVPAACATTTQSAPEVAVREAPTEQVRVTVSNVNIPVVILDAPVRPVAAHADSPAREHVRKMILATRSS